MASLIRTGNVGNTIVDQWGPQIIEMDKHQLMKFDEERLDENNQYVCVAVAKSPLYTGDAFRAARPVQLVDMESPQITDVAVNLNYENGVMNGIVSINFNKILYLSQNNKQYPLATMMNTGLITDADGKTYCGLGGKFPPMGNVEVNVTTVPSETSILSFNFKDVPGTNYTISLPIGLCNKWGYSAGAGTVKITYNKANDTFSYVVTPPAWQAKN